MNIANTISNPITNIEPASIALRYLAAWNEQNAARRGVLVAQTFTLDATYTDPMTVSNSHHGIDVMIDAAQKQFVGMRFTVHGAPDGHHNLVRFSWALGLP